MGVARNFVDDALELAHIGHGKAVGTARRLIYNKCASTYLPEVGLAYLRSDFIQRVSDAVAIGVEDIELRGAYDVVQVLNVEVD